MLKAFSGLAGFLLVVAGLGLVLYGWVLNILSLIQSAVAGSEFTLLIVLRAVGVFFAPLGAILGWVT